MQYWEVTQQILQKGESPLVRRPKLTEQLLRKPPFRFLQDVVLEVIKQSGFGEGLYTEEQLASGNIKDKDGKVAYLSKIINCVGIFLNANVAAKPLKIVAGMEPESTNVFLQMLGAAAVKNREEGGSKAVVQRLLAGEVMPGPGKGDPQWAQRFAQYQAASDAPTTSTPSQQPASPPLPAQQAKPPTPAQQSHQSAPAQQAKPSTPAQQQQASVPAQQGSPPVPAQPSQPPTPAVPAPVQQSATPAVKPPTPAGATPAPAAKPQAVEATPPVSSPPTQSAPPQPLPAQQPQPPQPLPAKQPQPPPPALQAASPPLPAQQQQPAQSAPKPQQTPPPQRAPSPPAPAATPMASVAAPPPKAASPVQSARSPPGPGEGSSASGVTQTVSAARRSSRTSLNEQDSAAGEGHGARGGRAGPSQASAIAPTPQSGNQGAATSSPPFVEATANRPPQPSSSAAAASPAVLSSRPSTREEGNSAESQLQRPAAAGGEESLHLNTSNRPGGGGGGGGIGATSAAVPPPRPSTASAGMRPQSARRGPPKLPSNVVAPDKRPGSESARPPTGSERPPSARPGGREPASLPAATVLAALPMPGGVILGEGTKDDDEDEDNADAIVMAPTAAAAEVSSAVSAEGAGKLVRDILETKKDLESRVLASDDDGRSGSPRDTGIILGRRKSMAKKEEGAVVKKEELQKLRETVQALCHYTNPLGKCLGYLQEDIENMNKEYNFWNKERQLYSARLEEQQRQTEEMLQESEAQLGQVDEELRQQQSRINATKAQILRNDEIIEGLIRMVVSGGVK